MFQIDTGVTMLNRKHLFLFLIFIFFLPLLSFSQSTISFVQITDTHIKSPESQQKLQDVLDDIDLLLRKPVFIINSGDITEFGSEKEFQAYLDIVDSYDFQFYHLIGNHDIRWSNVGKKRFKKMAGPLYQSFDYGEVHFILLDSGMLLEQYGHFSSQQLKWLEQDLAKTGKEQPIIISAHHPLFLKKCYVDNELELLKIIDDYNVVLFLSGHCHQNRHWKLNGIDFLMTQAVMSKNPGYRIIKVYPNGKISVFLRDILTQKTELDFSCSLKRSAFAVTYSMRSPRINKSYNDNMPVLMTLNKTIKSAEVSLDGSHWKSMQKSGRKYFENISTNHLSEGQHLLYCKFISKNDVSKIEIINFKIERGKTQLLYRAPTAGVIQSSPVLLDNSILIGSNDGNLYLFNKDTGAEQWHFSTKGAVVATPVVHQDTVFITSGDGFCYAVNAKTGQKIWQQKAGQSIFASPNYSAGKIFFGSSDSCLYALKSSNGEILWKYKTNGYIKAKPAVKANSICFGSWDGYFYCLSVEKGLLIWKQRISENQYYPAATSNPLIVVDKIFVASHDHTAHAYNLADGNVLWEHLKTDNRQPGYSSPGNFDDKVVFGSLTGHLFALSENAGKEIWTTTLADSLDPVFDSSPAIVYPDVVVGSIGGVLYGVNFNSGEKLWSRKLGNNYIFSSPVIKNSIVYVGSTDGCLYAVKILKK